MSIIWCFATGEVKCAHAAYVALMESRNNTIFTFTALI